MLVPDRCRRGFIYLCPSMVPIRIVFLHYRGFALSALSACDRAADEFPDPADITLLSPCFWYEVGAGLRDRGPGVVKGSDHRGRCAEISPETGGDRGCLSDPTPGFLDSSTAGGSKLSAPEYGRILSVVEPMSDVTCAGAHQSEGRSTRGNFTPTEGQSGLCAMLCPPRLPFSGTFPHLGPISQLHDCNNSDWTLGFDPRRIVTLSCIVITNRRNFRF
jgi:hypothetical protein